MTNYSIARCELHHPLIHGADDDSDPNISAHFLVFDTLTNEEFFGSAYQSENAWHHLRYGSRQMDMAHFIQHYGAAILGHPFIRNYRHIAQFDFRTEIVQIIQLSGNEQVAILKTLWLRILQRKWKNICRKRKDWLKEPSKKLLYREIYGKWPPSHPF